MSNRPTRQVVSVPLASSDGVFYGRYPRGDKALAAALGNIAAARLLNQATFGATTNSITAAASQTAAQWIAAQAAIAPTSIVSTMSNVGINFTDSLMTQFVQAPDQLRQRVAFALSEIFVVGRVTGGLGDNTNNYYWDLLVNGAFGSFRVLLENISKSYAMGVWLSTYRNAKGDPVAGTHADENYAREIQQLFSIGLVMLNQDGSVIVDGNGVGVPTYDQTEVQNVAKVFTGWASQAQGGQTGDIPFTYSNDATRPLVAYATYHDTTAKTILSGVQIAPGGTAQSDLTTFLDTLANHQNCGPFIGQQLIQRLVTSNPTAAYISRISAVWANDGSGNRGNLLAVVKAILTDTEATTGTGSSGYGKLREPILRITHLHRAFNATNKGASNQCWDNGSLSTATASMGQEPMNAGSVFNFFRPDYVQAGPLRTAGLVAPEFQITNENTFCLTNNILEALSSQYVDSTGTFHSGTDFDLSSNLSAQYALLQTASWEALAANPSAMVDQMNLVFMAGNMTSAMKTQLVNYATNISSAQPWARAAETAMLLIQSPQYSVQN